MQIKLKDGTVKEYGQAISVYDIAKDISDGLARAACAGCIDGEIVDLRTEISKDCELNIITADSPEGLKVIRHTASHNGTGGQTSVSAGKDRNWSGN